MHGPLNIKFANVKQFKDSSLFKPTHHGRQNLCSIPLQLVQIRHIQWQWDMIFFEHFGTAICHSTYDLQIGNTKCISVHAMKVYGGSKCTAPLILQLRIRW